MGSVPLPAPPPHHLLLGLGTCASVLPFPLGVRNSRPSRSSFLLAWSRRENPISGLSQTPPSPLDPHSGHHPSPGWGELARDSSGCKTAFGKGSCSTRQGEHGGC